MKLLVPLTYMAGDQEVTQQGCMAMAVSALPRFTIRRCSTIHWARDDFEVGQTEYANMHAQIHKLVHCGVDKLLDQLGQKVTAQGVQQVVQTEASIALSRANHGEAQRPAAGDVDPWSTTPVGQTQTHTQICCY